MTRLLLLALLLAPAGCVPPRVHPQPLRPLLCARGFPLHGAHAPHACGRWVR